MHCGISSSLMISDIGVLGFRKIIRIIRRLSFLQSITDMDIYCLLGRFGKVWFWGFGCLVCFGVGWVGGGDKEMSLPESKIGQSHE